MARDTGAWSGEETTIHTQALSGISNNSEDIYEFENDTSYRYYRLDFTFQYTPGMREISLYERSSPPDMDLQSVIITADAPPATGRVLVAVEALDSFALDVDLIASITRDGGSAWTSVQLEAVSSGGGAVVYAGSVDLSGQPSDAALRLRAKTDNGKRFRIHRWALQADQVLILSD